MTYNVVLKLPNITVCDNSRIMIPRFRNSQPSFSFLELGTALDTLVSEHKNLESKKKATSKTTSKKFKKNQKKINSVNF